MRVIERLNVLSFGAGNFAADLARFVPIESVTAKANPPEQNSNLTPVPVDGDLPEQLERDFRMLLLRFVSNDWIESPIAGRIIIRRIGQTEYPVTATVRTMRKELAANKRK